ncbi:MAG: TIM barrel protein [Candidatus Thermoplasmatota archaeon]
MIRYGPAGIPLSCKGRTLRDGIEDAHILGLNALEVQLVRTNVIERVASDEEAGLSPREIRDELIIEFVRKPGTKGEERLYTEDEIKGGDVLRVMSPGIAKDWEHLKQLGVLARDLDVQVSLHCPYYIDFTSEDDITRRSIESIKWGGLLTKGMGGTITVTHLGLYGDLSKRSALNRCEKHLREIAAWYKEQNIRTQVGIETSGRQEVAGSPEEIISLARKVPGCIPVLNFAHIHSRGNGSLKTKEDFQKVFDAVAPLVRRHYHTHFSGVEHEGGNEIRYTPIKKGDLRFEPLSECILDNDFEITIISDSPLLEHDAMYMKVILERVLTRREAKYRREMERKKK